MPATPSHNTLHPDEPCLNCVDIDLRFFTVILREPWRPKNLRCASRDPSPWKKYARPIKSESGVGIAQKGDSPDASVFLQGNTTTGEPRMAKDKQSRKRSQPKHKKQKKSQHDKRKRLQRPNPDRKKTSNAKVPLPRRRGDAAL
jgi:hypothetical protein